ncbi:MAG: spore cortex biosynthesis protein YabQ [Clostridia bacterium]|nr:spore cortex biosynthesis protein YabQ [Clostridia bacterium]
MFVTRNQIFVFLFCLSFGCCFGFVISLFNCFLPKKYKWLRVLVDAILGVCGALVFSCLSHAHNFPNLRMYMIIGVACGFFAYFKSFNILLAKIQEKIYNIFKSKKVKLENDRGKIQKISRRSNRRRSNVVSDTNISDGLPTDRDRGSQQAHGGI